MNSTPSKPDEPLELTVHALPSGEAAMERDAKRARMGRIKMLLVLLLCASPVIASYLTYYLIRPDGRKNYGELVAQRAMPATLLGVDLNAGANAAPKPLLALRDQWLFISVAGGACDVACEKHLYLQRQLRESLGKEKERLDWVWLVNDAAPVREALKVGVKDAEVWRVDAAALGAFLSPEPGKKLEDHLYVVDPIGNFMMRFPADIDPNKAKRDLNQLLRASRHWDQPGRDPAAAAKLPAASK